MRKFIIKLCKNVLCHFNEHFSKTKSVLTMTQKTSEPYIKHTYTCTNCGLSLGMMAENICKISRERTSSYWNAKETE